MAAATGKEDYLFFPPTSKHYMDKRAHTARWSVMKSTIGRNAILSERHSMASPQKRGIEDKARTCDSSRNNTAVGMMNALLHCLFIEQSRTHTYHQPLAFETYKHNV